jgi:lipopolysaccharide transport system ATP-binding protein
MSEVIIGVEGLGKSYRLHHQRQEGYVALRDVLTEKAHAIGRRLLGPKQMVLDRDEEEFWALRDVSFEIRQGEVVGIIGRNGAGKSTLLKILSRITEPTEGRVHIRGRVASLLEVGTGFHPELSGRENIYLNGAILGMTRAEVRRKFDEIVAFAEVEKFLDTPVKRYSSGMYVRLAFAVAAHLEPEILIVDEVLSVGDAEFQKKCLGKMDDASKGGKTVLLVSHDMRRVSTLCNRGILLNAGAIEYDGKMSVVADVYLTKRFEHESFSDLTGRGDRSGSGDAQFQSLELIKDEQPCRVFAFGEALTQRIKVNVKKPIGTAYVVVIITSNDGVPVHELWNINEGCHWVADLGVYTFTLTIDRILLYPGTYSVDLWVGDRNSARVDYIIGAGNFTVIQTPTSGIDRPLDRANGLVFQSAHWVCERRV